MKTKFTWILIFLVLPMLISATSCSNVPFDTKNEEIEAVSQNIDSSYEPKRVYSSYFDHLTPFDIEEAYYKVYEVKLKNGDFERRGVVTVENEVFYLGPLIAYFPEVDAEFSFFNIQRGQFVGAYIGDEYSGRLNAIKLYRNRTSEDSIWSVAVNSETRRGAFGHFGSYHSSTTPWQNFIEINILFSDDTGTLETDFDPPVDISGFFVDVPYVEASE